MQRKEIPELSIIIPVLNEAVALPALFEALGRQSLRGFEVLFSDGGSTDGSLEIIEELGAKAPFAFRVLSGERGRGRQMNAGARVASAPNLLFLHADSHFADAGALELGLCALGEATSRRGDERVAGHFALVFSRREEAPSFGYAYYEGKARLDRAECTHGDQGFLFSRAFFEAIGGFDEDLGLLEDTRLAENVRREGEWILLPAKIATSARRFEVEGLLERQVLNALIMNFAAIGFEPFFGAVGGVYRSQDRTDRLKLAPIFALTFRLLGELPWRERLRIWYRTGCYVRPHAWQIAFALDVGRGIVSGAAEEGRTPFLDLFDRWYDRLTDHLPGRIAAACLVFIWSRFSFLLFKVREGRG